VPWDPTLMMRLKLKDLQIFATAVEMGGIGKAAERLNYSQPAVSKAIANLERALGKRLLDRDRSGIRLTRYGEAVLKFGIAVVDDLRTGIEHLDFIADPTAGQVRIGCTEPTSVGIVSAVVDHIVRRHPKITIHVLPGERPELYKALSERRIEVALLQISNRETESEFSVEWLYDEPIAIICGFRHAYAKRRRISIADLADGLWAMQPSNSYIRKVITDFYRSNGLGLPRVATVFHNPHLGISLAARGRLLAAVPKTMLSYGSQKLPVKEVPVPLPISRRPVGIVTLRDRSLSPVAELFIENARAVATRVGLHPCEGA